MIDETQASERALRDYEGPEPITIAFGSQGLGWKLAHNAARQRTLKALHSYIVARKPLEARPRHSYNVC